ncbi:hypothetical protein DES34_101290 [Brevibacillus brevis]|nr:hypothetical protein C7J99_17195 [Brevibacillus brevis]RED35631.1 hypothetical protein DES34_101290 [Brevibacillus brevis]GEC87694.1 hypothetical protein BBR01nite_00250 [Brevibacillus brevis]VEF89258.1 Uncharacterised protein [Brevibacillus brevis]
MICLILIEPFFCSDSRDFKLLKEGAFAVYAEEGEYPLNYSIVSGNNKMTLPKSGTNRICPSAKLGISNNNQDKPVTHKKPTHSGD